MLCCVALCRYNPAITSSLTIPSGALYLDIPTITLIYGFCIGSYNDSHILDLNPTYAAQLANISDRITQNLGCGTPAQSPVYHAMLSRVIAYGAAHPDNAELNACFANYSPQQIAHVTNCVSEPELGVYYSPNEANVGPLVLGTPGAMGMMIAHGDPTYGVPTMVVERDGAMFNVTSDVGSVAACAQGVFDPDTLTFDTSNPVNATCWPW